VALPRLLRPSALLRRNALYRGVLGGSPAWMAVGAVIFGKRFAKKAFGKQVQVLTIEKLLPGQSMRIDTIKPKTRRHQRAMARNKGATAVRIAPVDIKAKQVQPAKGMPPKDQL
jgi:hypothetical protein